MLQSENPEIQQVAKDLFMYTYYLNGFEFSYMSFGNMLGTEFQRAFPEYIKALQDMNTEAIDNSDLDNFWDQFLLKRGNMGLIDTITYPSKEAKQEALQSGIHDTGKTVDEFGGRDAVPEFLFRTDIVNGKSSNELLRFSPELTDLYNTVVYIPLRSNTYLHYNAAQTLDEMMDVVYDQSIIDANRKTGKKKKNSTAVSYERYQSTKSQKETDSTRDANVPEPSEYSSSPSAATLADNDAEEMDISSMNKAVGSMSTEEADTSYTEYDAAMLNKKNADATQKEDSDIEEAQQKLMEDNDGKGLCIVP
jgi:hypothetical protein